MAMTTHNLRALPGDAGRRIDLFICEALRGLEPGLTRSTVQRLCGEGAVLADGLAVRKRYPLRGGEEIVITLPDAKPSPLTAQDIPLDIVYEDRHLIVVNKPRGLVVHPAPGHAGGTLVNALLHHCGASLAGIGGVERPGIVHRLDKLTSGLLVAAKTQIAHENLSLQLKNREVTRIYEAVAHGTPVPEQGSISAPIARHPTDRKRMAVARSVNETGAREALTHYRLLGRYRGFSHLELRLGTGRTHQIRVHLAHIGHPVAGDAVYGSGKGGPDLGGQCLHARTLALRHPVTGRAMEFTSPLPDYFVGFLERLSQ